MPAITMVNMVSETDRVALFTVLVLTGAFKSLRKSENRRKRGKKRASNISFAINPGATMPEFIPPAKKFGSRLAHHISAWRKPSWWNF
jgi:hypothetical protein